MRSRFHAYRLVVVFALCFLILSLLAQREGDTNGSDSGHINSLLFLEDPTAALTASAVALRNHLFVRSLKNSLNFGLSDSAYWVWLTLAPAKVDNHSLRVELGYPHLDELDVYRMEEGVPVKQYQVGDLFPFAVRPIKDRTFVLPVDFDANSNNAELLFRVKSKGSIQLPIRVKTDQQYQLDDRNEQLMLGFYYGILLGVLAYNLLLAIGTREPVYGYYCAYAVFLALFQLSQNGLAFEYLWGNHANWHQVSIPFFASMALLFCTRFTQLFLNISRNNWPGLNIGYWMVMAVFASLAISSFVVDRALVITLVSVAVSLAGIFMISTAYAIYLKGDDNAFFYLLAWTILLFGIVIYATKTLGLVPETFVTEYLVQIGSAIEMVLLSYALADRFNRLRNENVRFNAEAKATLESRVEQRTQELRQAILQFEAANDQLHSLSQRDPMTGLYNRRYFNEVLHTLNGKMASQSKPLALLMIDIDHFKTINDTRGHLTGDEVICKVAESIQTVIHDDACVSVRFGGEEFVVLLPDYDQHQCLMVAEDLRATVESHCFSSEVTDDNLNCGENQISAAVSGYFKITISIGIAVGVPRLSVDQTGLELLDQADQALYAAKASGRNCCVVYDPGATNASQSHAA